MELDSDVRIVPASHAPSQLVISRPMAAVVRLSNIAKSIEAVIGYILVQRVGHQPAKETYLDARAHSKSKMVVKQRPCITDLHGPTRPL